MSPTRVITTIALLLIASTFPAVLGTQANPQRESQMDDVALKVYLDYNREEIYADQIIVDFTPDFDFSAIEEFAERNGLQLLRLYPAIGEAVFRTFESDLDNAMFK
ncbi:MAG: hypothetical protein V3T94_05410, partial [Thermoplasmata archaeon]